MESKSDEEQKRRKQIIENKEKYEANTRNNEKRPVVIHIYIYIPSTYICMSQQPPDDRMQRINCGATDTPSLYGVLTPFSHRLRICRFMVCVQPSCSSFMRRRNSGMSSSPSCFTTQVSLFSFTNDLKIYTYIYRYHNAAARKSMMKLMMVQTDDSLID